jgi:glycerophosphoryl diester phosphodiesterase
MAAKDLGWLTTRPIAHRGFHDLAAGRPENSLAAFRAAIEAGYAIECDLHPTADHALVVFHDETLQRMTGRPGATRDLTGRELGQLQLGGTAECIPDFGALLSLTEGRVPLVVELKHSEGRDAGFAALVVHALKGYSGRVALMSFDPGILADLRAVAPDIPRGWIGEGGDPTNLDHLNAITALEVDFVSYNIDHLPTAATTFAREALGLPLICWTVATRAQREKADLWTDQITFETFAA